MDNNKMSDGMKKAVVKNARYFHLMANAGPELIRCLEYAVFELARDRGVTTKKYMATFELGKRIKSALNNARRKKR